MSLRQNNGSQDLQIRTVWYGGTSQLQEGQALVYDTDDTAAPVAPAAGDLSPTSRRNLRGRRVVDVTAALTGGVAGLVAADSSGVTGPAFVDIVVPRRGDVVTAFCKVNATKNSTVVGIDTAGPSNNIVSFADATFNFNLVGIALETKDTSATAGPTLIKFL